MLDVDGHDSCTYYVAFAAWMGGSMLYVAQQGGACTTCCGPEARVGDGLRWAGGSPVLHPQPTMADGKRRQMASLWVCLLPKTKE